MYTRELGYTGMCRYSKIPILRPPLVFKTTFGQPQRWSLIRGKLGQGVENEEKIQSNFANKVFNRQDVLILGGLNSGISLF